MTTALKRTSSNNWPVLILALLTFAFTYGTQMACMPVMFKEIARDLGLNLVQIGSSWGMISFGSIFIIPLGGYLCDRLGTKRTIILIGLLSGICGALRAFSGGFVSLMATTFLWGLVSAAVIPAINKVASLFSSGQRQGLAQGLCASGLGLGLTVGSLFSATILSPWLEGWRNVLFLYSGAAIIVSLLWLGVKVPEGRSSMDTTGTISIGGAFAYLLRLKKLWLLGLSMLGYQGCILGMQGYLAYYLQDQGWTAVSASGAIAAYNAVGIAGSIPMTLLSDRTGSRKIFLVLAFSSAILGIGLMAVVHNAVLWFLVILAGVFAPMSSALFTTICIEMKQIGVIYSGSAVGLMLAIAFIGRSFAPPLGDSLANISLTVAWPFVFWAALGVVGLVLLCFVDETGLKGEVKMPPKIV